jgi:phosphoglycolate phosphatase
LRLRIPGAQAAANVEGGHYINSVYLSADPNDQAFFLLKRRNGFTGMKLLLFDIDGTLVLSGGAGKRAMNRVFEELYGYANVMEGITLSGRTDDKIMMDAYAKAGIEFSRAELDRFKERYFEIIKLEMLVDHNGKRIMPGVAQLLPELQKRDDIYLALLTGNWEQGGRTKIGYFGLDHFFPFGAFSDDSAERTELVPIAVRRFQEIFSLSPDPREVYIIGDTPADVQCAKPHGVVSVAVAAASHTVEDLQPFEPDVLLADLADLPRVLEILG